MVIAQTTRSAQALLAPLQTLAMTSDRLHVSHHPLPRFVFDGPRSGGDPIRLGLFTGIHGDEPQGPVALASFLIELAQQPELATGYQIFAYPLCNPAGYEKNSRWLPTGRDLNREFWHDSPEAGVRYLEEELRARQFHGIISLHSDDASPGSYGFTRGPDLSKDLLEPALWAAERHLQRNTNRVIDGFQARRGLIEGGYAGILSAPADQRPAPFEIVFETPALAPLHLQGAATTAALRSILTEYRAVISRAQHI